MADFDPNVYQGLADTLGVQKTDTAPEISPPEAVADTADPAQVQPDPLDGHSRVVRIGPHTVAFPDRLTDDEIREAAGKIHSNLPPMPKAPQPEMETSLVGAIGEPLIRGAENFATGLGRMEGTNEQVKAGLTEAVQHPLDTLGSVLGGIGEQQASMLDKVKEAWRTGDYPGALSAGINYALPFIGPQTQKAGEQLNAGDISGGIGTTLAAGANVAAGALGPKALPVAPSAETSLLRPISSGFKAAEQAAANEAQTAGIVAEQKAATALAKPAPKKPIAYYNGKMPKNLYTTNAKLKWLDENITPEFKQRVANHELGHYAYARQAGVPAEDLEFTLGHVEQSRGNRTIGTVLVPDDFWRSQMKNAKSPVEKQQAAHKFLKYAYAPEIIEARQGESPENVAAATLTDRRRADEFMKKVMGLNEQEREQTRAEILKQLDKEITPTFMNKINKASAHLSEHHFAKDTPSFAVEHYLWGGNYTDIADRLTEAEPPANNLDSVLALAQSMRQAR